MKITSNGRKKLINWTLLKLKILSFRKHNMKVKRQSTDWKLFVNHISGKGLVSMIYKEVLQLNDKTNNGEKISVDISAK